MAKLFIVRHAHREKVPAQPDNGLSKRGLEQAEWVGRYLSARLKDDYGNQGDYSGLELTLFSSPRLRCRETLYPFEQGLSRWLGAVAPRIQVVDLLDEHRPAEDSLGLVGRIDSFVRMVQGMPEDAWVVACSHGDWIPVLVERLFGRWDLLPITKGSVLEIDFYGKQKPVLESFLSDLSFLKKIE